MTKISDNFGLRCAILRRATARPKYATEVERKAAKAQQRQERTIRERDSRRSRGLKNHRVDAVDSRPPIEVLAIRDALPPHASTGAALLGDPRPGRSALDQRARATPPPPAARREETLL